ncbi:hypothetical protein TBK1r_54310 [Stieleria magnilauensis]|uniref:Uncharacterized protein n=1 Tax=Stieleria magnilauensis TaxID=2527963 RepID=A0ABX5XXI3_9BACT|nr:hypothetical protein TBK1r_54310 [Planctomycetes bacterium TBK1r]
MSQNARAGQWGILEQMPSASAAFALTITHRRPQREQRADPTGTIFFQSRQPDRFSLARSVVAPFRYRQPAFSNCSAASISNVLA